MKNSEYPQELIIDAILLDYAVQAPLPGTVHIIPLMKYKVIESVEGKYEEEHVLVGHHFADLTEGRYQAGSRHRLHLIKDFPSGATILNHFEEENHVLPRYYCKKLIELNREKRN